MANTRVKAKLDGVLSPKGFDKYSKQVKREILRAYKVAQTPAIKDIKNYMGGISKQFFKVKSKNFKNMYTGAKYDKKQDKLPTTLFYTRTPYWNLFETGGNIKPKNAKGLIVPFEVNGGSPIKKTKGKSTFKALLKFLKDNKKSFWKKVNGNLILFAIVDKESSRKISKYKKDFRARKGLKKVKAGSIIPIAVLKSKIYIRKRFNYTNLVKNKYIPTFLDQFSRNVNL